MAFFKARAQNPEPAQLEQQKLLQAPFAEFTNLPRPYKQAGRKDLDFKSYYASLSKQQNFPVHMLQDATSILSTLNRMSMKPAKRLELADMILRLAYPMLAIWYYKYQCLENSLPESNDRRKTLIASIEVLEQLAIAYKHYFKDNYSTTEKLFSKARNKLSLAGFRLLEVLMLLQRIKALRYQKLSRTDWQNCNQVFFSMALFNAVDDIHDLHGSVGIREQSQKHHRKGLLKSSIRRLYLSIQLFGLMDVSTWPTRMFHVPDAYLEYLGDDGLKIVNDNGQALKPGFLCTALTHEGPPLFERRESMKLPVVLIDFTTLSNTLVKDHEEIGKMKFIAEFDLSKLSRPLQKLGDEDRVPVLDLMLLALQRRKRQQRRHPVFSQESLKVYFSKKEVLRLLTDLNKGDIKEVLKSRQFVDTLAQQSAMLATDEEVHMRATWRIVNFSTGGMLISTRETDFSNPVQLGQLMAFIPADHAQQPTLGVVIRLSRPDDGFVEVAIQRLSSEAEEAFLFEQGEIHPNQGRPVVLFQDLSGHWLVVVSHSDDFVPGKPFLLVRTKGPRIPVRLGDVWMSKKEFVIFELRSPGLN